MTFRELLRYEIWSKETSRRIVGRIWKFLKPAAVVFGILVLLLGIVFVVERFWITNGELSSGRAALAQIEELEKLVDCNCDRFSTADSKARAAVEVAEKKAWTLRDHGVAFELSFYLSEIEERQTQDLREAQAKLFMQQKQLQWHSNPQFDEDWRSSYFRIFNMFRSALHKELD